eukprot:jgi/Tetstr1/428952/TSEL_018927.t1
MQHKAGYWLRNCLPSHVEAFAEAVDAAVLAAVERVLGVSFDPSTYGTDTNPVVTDFLAELLHDPDPMAAEVATLSEDAMAMARNMLHLPTRLKGAGIRRMATVRDAAFIGCMNAILPRFMTRNSGTNTPTPGFFDPQLGSVLGRGSFNATFAARQYDHFLNDAHGSDSYAAEMREAWGRLQAATAGHLGNADARVMEREVEAASGSQKELTAFPDQAANNSRLRNEVCALPATCRERILFNQLDAASGMWTVAIPTARTVMTPHELREVAAGDELKDLVPDAELSLPAFNVVTGSYDPRSLKSTLLEFKTMRYGVKYTLVTRVTAVDRFERSLLGDIQRGLAARDAAWHNTEPGQKGPLRDMILDMSEYTGMVFGTVGACEDVLHTRNPLLFAGDESADKAAPSGETPQQLPASFSAAALPGYDFPYSPSSWAHPSGRLSPIRTRPAEVSGWKVAFGAGGPGPAYSLQVLVPLGGESPHGGCAARSRNPTARRLLWGTLLLLLLAVAVGVWFGLLVVAREGGPPSGGDPARCWPAAAAASPHGQLSGDVAAGASLPCHDPISRFGLPRPLRLMGPSSTHS